MSLAEIRDELKKQNKILIRILKGLKDATYWDKDVET